jgi:microcin C transport system ATP-binding protein
MSAELSEGEPLLSVRNLAVSFRQGGKETRAVKGISFDIKRGETVAVVGESGSGKSVSALSVVRLLAYPAASHPSGEIVFKGQDLLKADETAMRKLRGNDITMIFQEPMTSLNPLHTIRQQIDEILELHGRAPGEQRQPRIIELLTKVGIPNPEERLSAYPHQLSGGQRQRIMIAMALANEPDLLIADEPTTALDVTVQAQILALLKSLQQELGMAILFITHDLNIVRKLAHRVVVMQHGEVREQGSVREVFARPQHPYTQALLAAEPKGSPAPSDLARPVVVQTDSLKIWFPIRKGLLRRVVGHVKAVDEISLAIREGETLGVVGESGSGKTTLGQAILRLIRSDGPILYLGQRIDQHKFKQMRPLRKDMQVVFQDPFGSLSPRMSVAEIVAEGLLVQTPGMSLDQQRSVVAKALVDVGLDPQTMDRYPHEFSGGQRQRIAIARAMALNPKFVVLDEPTSALDRTVQVQIVELLKKLQRERQIAYLFISHDLQVVKALANELIVMKSGKVVEAGPAAEIFAGPKTEYTKALIAAAFSTEMAGPDRGAAA